MSVWLTIPSKRPPEEAEPILKQWRERGYKVALARDSREECDHYWRLGLCQHFNYPLNGSYKGYAISCNNLISEVALIDPTAEWFVCGGDDVLPDPNHSAEEIAAECREHFRQLPSDIVTPEGLSDGSTWGVMQPTGDRWGIDPNTHAFVSLTPGCDSCACKVCGRGEVAPVHLMGAYIDRVAGSPWIGREFARRMYQGKGPYWPEYTHMGVDEELQAVAEKQGVFWQRPDLTHFHQHWGRPREGETIGQYDRMPEFLKHANSAGEWKRYKRIVSERKAMGFPGSDPL